MFAAAPPQQSKSSGPVSKRAVEPLAATMLSSGPLSGSPLAAFAPAKAPPPASAASPPINDVPTVSAPPSANPVAGLAPLVSGSNPVRPAARPAENFIGRTLNNRYVVEDKIGEGGFGAVFRGKQIATGREVALKILHPHNVSGDPTIVARFRREAGGVQQAPRSAHGHHLRLRRDRGRDPLPGDGACCGEHSLHQLQKSEGPFPFERVLDILDQVSESLGRGAQERHRPPRHEA